MNKQSSDTKSKSGSSSSQREDDRDGLVDKSHEVAEQVKQATLERVDSVRQSAQTMRDDAAERVRKLGATVRKVGEHFRIEDQNYVAEKMTGASQHLGTLAGYIGSAEIGVIVRDARSVARKNPALFLGGMFVAGLGVGRFLKGTSLIASGAMSSGASNRNAMSSTEADRPDDIGDNDVDVRRSRNEQASRNRASR